MIIKEKQQTRLEFGNGDIGVASARGQYKDKVKGAEHIGIVIFKNQEPREIGSVADMPIGEVNLGDFPVIMTFSKKESIDVVIKHLEETRQLMGQSSRPPTIGGGMIYTFPRTKFVDKNTEEEQILHIYSEMVEMIQDHNKGLRGNVDGEMMDIYHSLESFFRKREEGGIDIGAVAEGTYQKNLKRDYYAKGD